MLIKNVKKQFSWQLNMITLFILKRRESSMRRLNVKHKIKPSELKLNGEKSNGGIDDDAKNLYRNRP